MSWHVRKGSHLNNSSLIFKDLLGVVLKSDLGASVCSCFPPLCGSLKILLHLTRMYYSELLVAHKVFRPLYYFLLIKPIQKKKSNKQETWHHISQFIMSHDLYFSQLDECPSDPIKHEIILKSYLST
jgi:hypothetical protein